MDHTTIATLASTPPPRRRLLSLNETKPRIAELENLLGLPPSAKKIVNVLAANTRLETLEELFQAHGGTIEADQAPKPVSFYSAIPNAKTEAVSIAKSEPLPTAAIPAPAAMKGREKPAVKLSADEQIAALKNDDGGNSPVPWLNNRRRIALASNFNKK